MGKIKNLLFVQNKLKKEKSERVRKVLELVKLFKGVLKDEFMFFYIR